MCLSIASRWVACGVGLLCLLAGLDRASAGEGPGRYLKNEDRWFGGDEAKRIGANILACQSELGGWPKHVDTTLARPSDPTKLRPTFDNGATTDELRFLARVFNATQDQQYRAGFERGLDYILKAQYPTGGWPQSYPPDNGYARHTTFNDDAMVRVMELLRESYTLRTYDFLGSARREAARRAFERGIECILKCQIKVDGHLTVWCAQHDELDYAPRPGRTFELTSLSGSESVGIVELLMSLDPPTPQVARAIESAVAWFEVAKLEGIREVIEADPRSPSGRNKVIVKDPAAPPLWARFYEIGTNRSIFAGRDGVARHDLAEIGYERRNGYGWLGDSPRRLLEREYPEWKKKWPGKIGS